MVEIVEHGKTGLLFRPGDAKDLAAKIQWAYEHPEEMQKMGVNARKEFEAKYTAEKNYQMLMEIYQKAIKNHRNSKKT
jgi:glycosyltransferase involved in cell wall biosynthesis